MISEDEYNKAKEIVEEYELNKFEEEQRTLEDLTPELNEILRDWDLGDIYFSKSSWGEIYHILFSPEPDELSLHVLADNHRKEVEALGEKYSINIKFPYWYYGK